MAKFYSHNAPPIAIRRGYGSLPVAKSRRMKVSHRRWYGNCAKNWALTQRLVNMLPAISGKCLAGLSIFMPGTYRTSTGRYRHTNIRRWSGVCQRKHCNIRWLLLIFHYFMRLWLYAPPDQRIGANGFVIPLALQQYPLRFNHCALRLILILINAALVTGLRRFPARTKHLRRHIHFHIRTVLRVSQRK